MLNKTEERTAKHSTAQHSTRRDVATEMHTAAHRQGTQQHPPPELVFTCWELAEMVTLELSLAETEGPRLHRHKQESGTNEKYCDE